MSSSNPMTKFISKVIHKPYYYVSPCPRCNSPMTGYFVKHNIRDVDNKWRMKEALINGELISECIEIPERNVFCVNCGFTWRDNVEMKLFSLERINEEKKKRGTNEVLTTLYCNKDEESKKGNAVSKYFKNL